MSNFEIEAFKGVYMKPKTKGFESGPSDNAQLKIMSKYMGVQSEEFYSNSLHSNTE